MSQIIVDVSDFILGWKIVYLSVQCLSFCQYALYRELIKAIDRAFSFRLLGFVKQTPLQTHQCNFVHSWSGLLYELFWTAVLNWVQYLWVVVNTAALLWWATTFSTCTKCASLRASSFLTHLLLLVGCYQWCDVSDASEMSKTYIFNDMIKG